MTRRTRAVSPVIATVILIAVAVALGIAVAFWASGLTSSFSKYEKLGVNTQYSSLCSYQSSPATCVSSLGSGQTYTSGWNIVLGGQNSGSSDASITQIQVNGVPITMTDVNYNVVTSGSCTPSKSVSSSQPTIPVPSGQTFCLEFTLPTAAGSGSQTFASGQTVQVTIITAAGNNYPASIVLQ
jgi:flagellin-like protein